MKLPLVIVKLQAGLGNQMFQYAFGLAFAKSKNATLLFDKSFYASKFDRQFQLDNFNISSKCFSLSFYKGIGWGKVLQLLKLPFKFFKIRENDIEQDVFQLDKKILYFDGYWQNYEFIDYISDDLKREFSFKNTLNLQSQELLEKIKNRETVAIHIRLGDYIKEPSKSIFHVCNFSYYKKAIEYCNKHLQNPVFIIFSENYDIVKKELQISGEHFFADFAENDPINDLQFMSLCKHNIISNSTYSWWAAYLNNNPDKIIIAPDKWYNKIDDEKIIQNYKLQKVLETLSKVNLIKENFIKILIDE